MDIQAYISSGILELYVIGALSSDDMKEVEEVAGKYPEIQIEIYEISRSLEQYARLRGKELSPEVWSGLQQKLASQNDRRVGGSMINPSKSRDSFINGLYIILAVALSGVFGYLLYQSNQLKKNINELQSRLIQCDSLKDKMNLELDKLYAVSGINVKRTVLQPNPEYNSVKMVMHSDVAGEKNIMQILQAPGLNIGEVYQLWYFDDKNTPVPLETFTGDQLINQFSFIPQAKVYAITIEPEGGSTVPTLSRLIGTFSLM
ncbi:MAG: anti-sigma factor [Saprospiraceae bacterium]|nr:anti-sigma factor [Saprospiraceae bacterium]